MIILHLSGGLGNQMFQYAFGRATARRLDAELVFDLSNATLQIHNGFELDRVFNIEGRVARNADMKAVMGCMRYVSIRRLARRLGLGKVLPVPYVLEPHYHFAQEMLSIPDNKYLSGYWQSEKYFEKVAGTIRSDFTFRAPFSSLDASVAAKMSNQNETAISLHVRRGDYVSNEAASQVYGKCTSEYYRKAIIYVAERVKAPHLYIFSDDMDWVKNNMELPLQCTFVEHNRGALSFQDMRLMSMCKHHIIANSSFSWWGAWLSPAADKIVIAPKKWFADGRSIDDLFPSDWVTL